MARLRDRVTSADSEFVFYAVNDHKRAIMKNRSNKAIIQKTSGKPATYPDCSGESCFSLSFLN